LTGLSLENVDISAKWAELLVIAVPHAKRAGVLWDPSFAPADAELRMVEGAARSLNLVLAPVGVRASGEIEPAFRTMAEQRADALIVLPAPLVSAQSERIADLAVKAQMPAMFYRREFVEAGGLMSYGTSFASMYRRAAAYVDRTLKGAKPADLPVEQPTKFELVINLNTAKALGLTLPQLLLGRADEVIE